MLYYGYDRKHSFTNRVKSYQGQYVAVSANKVVASGKTAKEVYDVAKKLLGKKKVEGVYYIPQKKDFLTALCVFPSFSIT